MANGIQGVITEARTCALVMLENASYIERELLNVDLPDDLRDQTVQLCSDLSGTKHDIFSELFELDEILATPTRDSTIVASRLERIIRWLSDDLPKMHGLVAALQSASERDSQFGLGCTLVTEAAANILQAFNRVCAAAEHLQGDSGKAQSSIPDPRS